MNLIVNAFNLILYQPLFNALILLYQYLPGRDFGIAVIILTLLIRLILYPSMAQSLKSQKALADLQPKIQEIQKKYKNDIAKQGQATIELYRKEKINPLSGIFPLLVQLPILIALYRLFWKGLDAKELVYLYNFVPNPGLINPTFLGILNLAQPSIVLAILAGIFQFFQSKMILPAALSKKPVDKKKIPNFSEALQKQMLYFFPVFTVFILWKLPAAIGLYWIATTVFSIFQQYLIFKPRSEISNREFL